MKKTIDENFYKSIAMEYAAIKGEGYKSEIDQLAPEFDETPTLDAKIKNVTAPKARYHKYVAAAASIIVLVVAGLWALPHMFDADRYDFAETVPMAMQDAAPPAPTAMPHDVAAGAVPEVAADEADFVMEYDDMYVWHDSDDTLGSGLFGMYTAPSLPATDGADFQMRSNLVVGEEMLYGRQGRLRFHDRTPPAGWEIQYMGTRGGASIYSMWDAGASRVIVIEEVASEFVTLDGAVPVDIGDIVGFLLMEDDFGDLMFEMDEIRFWISGGDYRKLIELANWLVSLP